MQDLLKMQVGFRITPQEKRILQLVVNGFNNKEIASELNISVRTVEVHRQNLFRKMDVDNVVKLVRLSLQLQLVD
jgi:two-component system nitrate/nitrite response regulator NarL